MNDIVDKATSWDACDASFKKGLARGRAESSDHIEAQNKLIEEMREALQSACEELYQISHSGGDPDDESNMDSYAEAYRECRSALSKSNPNTPERNDE